jgi:hypothetical protein
MANIVHPPDLNPVSIVSVLDSVYADTFKEALTRVLLTEVAEFTFSEILDGLPTEDSFREFNARLQGNPVFELEHNLLCPGAIKRIRSFRDAFDPLTLTFSPAASCIPRLILSRPSASLESFR